MFLPSSPSQLLHGGGQQPRARALHLGLRTRCHSVASSRGRSRCRANATEERQAVEAAGAKADGTSSSEEKKEERDESATMKQTLLNLDALLGIEEEEEKKKEGYTPSRPALDSTAAAATLAGSLPLQVGVSEKVVKELLKEELLKGQAGKISDEEMDKIANSISGKLDKLVKGMVSPDLTTPGADLEVTNLVKDVSDLLTGLVPDLASSQKDVQAMKEKVFGPNVFWVTDIRMAFIEADGSWLVRGNVRMPQEKLLETVSANLKEHFGDKYEILLTEDPDVNLTLDMSGPLGAGQNAELGAKAVPAFLVVPTSAVEGKVLNVWQKLLALGLGLASLVLAVQLGWVTSLPRLSKELVEALTDPNSDALITEQLLMEYDFTPFLASSLPITLGVALTQAASEAATRVLAFRQKVKVGAPFFIPNPQLGTFGSIAPIKSLVKSRAELFDLSVAGPLAAGLTSAALLAAGLALSHAGLPKEELLAAPPGLLNSSLLLGSLTKAVLGVDGAVPPVLYIHPLVVPGWVGLLTTALNCLPVGRIPGGRIYQALFGRGALGVTSFLTYVGLALGFLGSNLALPFGLLVLFLQRDPQKYLKDDYTSADNGRRSLGLLVIGLAILTLLPALPEVVDTGISGPFI